MPPLQRIPRIANIEEEASSLQGRNQINDRFLRPLPAIDDRRKRPLKHRLNPNLQYLLTVTFTYVVDFLLQYELVRKCIQYYGTVCTTVVPFQAVLYFDLMQLRTAHVFSVNFPFLVLSCREKKYLVESKTAFHFRVADETGAEGLLILGSGINQNKVFLMV